MKTIAKVSFFLIVLIMIFACASPNAYNLKLNSLIGASKSDIESQFGRPSAIKIIGDNSEILAYTNVDNVFVPSEFYTYSQGNEIYGEDGLFSPFLSTYLFSDNPGDIGYEAKYICKTLFLLENNKVVAWKWQGNDCN